MLQPVGQSIELGPIGLGDGHAMTPRELANAAQPRVPPPDLDEQPGDSRDIALQQCLDAVQPPDAGSAHRPPSAFLERPPAAFFFAVDRFAATPDAFFALVFFVVAAFLAETLPAVFFATGFFFAGRRAPEFVATADSFTVESVFSEAAADVRRPFGDPAVDTVTVYAMTLDSPVFQSDRP